MTDDRVPKIFNKALTLDESKRAGYLIESCEGDVVLLTEVSSLLQHYTGIETKVETRTAEIPGIYKPGSVIDRYKILKRLGEGGQGIVYLAKQMKPVKRQVALKVIKPGMDTKAVIARFEAEQQALAIMNHPGIARVYDAGSTTEGRPYFVMEYIDGVPITTYCDEQKLDIHDRIELLIKVCDAVQHAHQNAVLHRDLKPPNILVMTDSSRMPQPKVIDFGIAKAISQPLTNLTHATEQGQFLGTPEYMSPEQAMGMVVDTRSDVYSLGVVIYNVLSGVLPFDFYRSGKFLRPDDVQKTICHVPAPFPSTKLIKLSADDQRRVARERNMQFDALKNTLSKELEWIPLMAIRKEAHERYNSVESISDDLRRYIDGEPLQAAPESTAYRVRKLILRNKGPFIATSLVAILLIAGLVVFTILQVRLSSSRANEKKGQEEKEEAIADKAKAEYESGKQAAERIVLEYIGELGEYEKAIMKAQLDMVDDPDQAKIFLSDARNTLKNKFKVQTDEEMPFEWRYLNALAHEGGASTKHQQIDNKTDVKSLVFVNDGQYLASVDIDKYLRIWDENTTEEVKAWPSRKAITSVASNTNGELVVFGSRDNYVREWNHENDNPVNLGKRFSFAVTAVALHPQSVFVAVGTEDGVITILDKTESSAEEVTKLNGHEEEVLSLAFNPDGDKLASSGADGQVFIWKWETSTRGDLLQSHVNPAGLQRTVAFSRDGKWLATGGTTQQSESGMSKRTTKSLYLVIIRRE